MITQTAQHNTSVIKRFVSFVKNKRLAHTYLFLGVDGAAKSETALAVAKLVNCLSLVDGMFCDTCESCMKINNGHHPDVWRIEVPSTGSIKIDDIRTCIRRFALRPFEGHKKVCIITHIENITHEAANALLKTLEEPSSDSLLILTSRSLKQVLGTIVSRCHIIRFYPMADGELLAHLTTERNLSRDAAYFLTRYSEGCVAYAQQLHDAHFAQKKNKMIDSFVFGKNTDAYIKELARDKEQLQEFLRVLFTWFRDMAVCKAGGSRDEIIHSDRIEDIMTSHGAYSFDELDDIICEITTTAQSLKDNFNVKVALSLLKEKIWRR